MNIDKDEKWIDDTGFNDMPIYYKLRVQRLERKQKRLNETRGWLKILEHYNGNLKTEIQELKQKIEKIREKVSWIACQEDDSMIAVSEAKELEKWIKESE